MANDNLCSIEVPCPTCVFEGAPEQAEVAQVYEKLFEFVRTVAELRKDGELDDEGEEWTMENDDAYDTVMTLISEARSILGIEDPPECEDREWVEN
jgi:hypothetical protein